MPIWLVDLLVYWKGSRRYLKIVGNLIPSCLIWCTWKEMNARSFKECKKKSSDLQILKSLNGSLQTSSQYF